MEHWTEYTRFLTALLVILDPLAAVPVFAGATRGFSRSERNKAATIAVLTVTTVLIGSAGFGEAVLKTLGTSLSSFRVAGGLVLLLMALAMLSSEPYGLSPLHEEGAVEKDQRQWVGVVPLGIPLLAGPGAISTVIIELQRSQAPFHFWLVLLDIVIACFILWLALRFATVVASQFGKVGINVLTRIFGLILAAIATEIMANGFRELFPVLAAGNACP